MLFGILWGEVAFWTVGILFVILAASAGHSVDPSWITAPEGLQRIRDALAGASISG
jgi:hypothetical protein